MLRGFARNRRVGWLLLGGLVLGGLGLIGCLFVISDLGFSPTAVERDPAASFSESEPPSPPLSSEELLDASECPGLPSGEGSAEEAAASELPEFFRLRRETCERYRTRDSIEEITPDLSRPFEADIKVIVEGPEALIAKILLIRGTRQTIDIAHYVLSRDTAGYLILNELRDALHRGVSVRILLDSLGSGQIAHAELKALLETEPGFVVGDDGKPTAVRATVQTVLFHPVVHVRATAVNWARKVTNLFRPRERRLPDIEPNRNRRLHDKLILADAQDPERAVAITGGRGIANDYYGIPERGPRAFEDIEIMVRNARKASGDHGPSHLGTTLGAYYDRLFFHLGNKQLSRTWRWFLEPQMKRELQRMANSAERVLSPGTEFESKLREMRDSDYLHAGFETASGRLLHELQNIHSGNLFRNSETLTKEAIGKNPASILGAYQHMLLTAERTLDIVSPYFTVTAEEAGIMHEWLSADPKRRIRILTNSLITNDSVTPQVVTDESIGNHFFKDPAWQSLRGQLEVYGYGRLDDSRIQRGGRHYGTLHAKFFVMDGKRAIVTSDNLDPRSRHLQSESGIEIEGNEALVAQLTAKVDSLVLSSAPWGGEEWKAIRDRQPGKKALFKVLSRIIWFLHLKPLI